MLLYLGFKGHTDATSFFSFMAFARKWECACLHKRMTHLGHYVNYPSWVVRFNECICLMFFFLFVFQVWSWQLQFREVKLLLYKHLWLIDQWLHDNPSHSTVCLWKQIIWDKRAPWKSRGVAVVGDEMEEAARFEIQLSLTPPHHHHHHPRPSYSQQILCAHGPQHCHRNLPFNHNRNLISCFWQKSPHCL